jgi:putative transposase
MTFHLRRLGYIVNAKKVRRLMKEASLLNHRYNEHRPVKRVVAASVVVKAPNMVWEFDIKYVHVQGEGRNVFLLCFEDCYTREIVNLLIGHHCTGSDVSAAIAKAFHERGITEIAAVRLRSDNGTQFVCSRVERLLDLMRIEHERIHPQTPKEDAHIESFNSILEREVIRRFEFISFEDARSTVTRFVEFYNTDRLHSAIGYMTPREVYVKWKEENTGKQLLSLSNSGP